MSTGPPAAARHAQRHEDRVRNRMKRRDGGQSKAALRASHPRAATQSAQSSEEEVSRLREVVGQLHREGCGSEKEEDLRWRITQLERDKLDQTAKYNQEVSAYEAQLARLRALLERGEAHRQTLEYEVAVAKRDAAVQRTCSEDKMAELHKHNQQLEGLNAELSQRASDLERALEITRQAREDDQQNFQTELQERDRLLLSASAESYLLRADRSQLETLLEEQNGTLQKLQEKLVQVQRERDIQAEELREKTSALREKTSALRSSTDREEKLAGEVESAMQRIKDLEENVESERAAHLESKFNSDIIQLRLRDVEESLSLEKSGHADAQASLELMRQKFGELEKAHTHEIECVQSTQHTLQQLEKEYLNTKMDLIGQLDKEKTSSAELIGQLDKEKAELSKLSLRLQEQERVQMESQKELSLVQKELGLVQDSYKNLLKEMEQLLQPYHHQGAPQDSYTGNGDKRSASVLLCVLRQTLYQYHTELKDLVKVVEMLNKDTKEKEKIISEQRRNVQECEARSVCLCEEVDHLRRNAERVQTELQSVTHRWEEEKEQHAHTKTHTHRLTQEYERDQQEKLSFLHSLYQQLVAGCVLVAPPQSILGSFSWAELSTILQEHVDVLTSDLHSANQRLSHLETVCEGKTAALVSVCEQLKEREENWIKQREELDTHHTRITNELHSRVQDLKSQLEQAEDSIRVSERTLSDLRQEVTHLQDLLCVCRHDDASLLAACALLAGCVCALHGRLCALAHQKALLWNRACDRAVLQEEVATLLHALGDPGVKGHVEGRGGVWRFRRGVIAVLATLRLQTLRRNSHTLFRVAGGYGERPNVCVRELWLKEGSEQREKEEENSRMMKMLRSSELSVIIHSCMQGVGVELDKTECGSGVLAAAQNSFSKLLERLLAVADSDCRGHCRDQGSLAWQLGQGLHRLRTTQHIPSHYNSKWMVSSLQQHFLVFTQRLHSAEVERRDLRIELSRLKRHTTHPSSDPRTTTSACVPIAQFDSVCEQLSSALQREQQAQALLHQQATQLQELGLTMELHTEDQLEKERTLTQAVQSLSDTKAELRRKEQSLRLLGKRLSQLQKEKQKLQQSINSAENALHMAAKSKDILCSYMRCVDSELKELKDCLILSRFTTSKEDISLHLPRMHLDMAGVGGAEITVCQSVVKSFMEVYRLACSKMASLEKELHDVCHRDNQSYTPMISPDEPQAPLSKVEEDSGTTPSLDACFLSKVNPSVVH